MSRILTLIVQSQLFGFPMQSMIFLLRGLSSYGWYDKLGVVKIPKSHIHQYREDSHRRVKSKGHAERAILFCFLAVARP
jgi:hypothetical protein